MRYLILFLLLIPFCGHAQQWHKASDTLTHNPKYYPATKYFNRHDTIPCAYILIGDTTHHIYHGFKIVFLKDGFYTDDETTMYKFYDSSFHLIKRVDSYSFKISL